MAGENMAELAERQRMERLVLEARVHEATREIRTQRDALLSAAKAVLSDADPMMQGMATDPSCRVRDEYLNELRRAVEEAEK